MVLVAREPRLLIRDKLESRLRLRVTVLLLIRNEKIFFFVSDQLFSMSLPVLEAWVRLFDPPWYSRP